MTQDEQELLGSLDVFGEELKGEQEILARFALPRSAPLTAACGLAVGGDKSKFSLGQRVAGERFHRGAERFEVLVVPVGGKLRGNDVVDHDVNVNSDV